MYTKWPEGSLGAFCRKHTSCCLCWPNKWVSVGLGLCSGLLLLVCWYKSAVQAALAASTWEVTLFLKIYQNKSSCTRMLRIGWQKMYSQDICNFSFPCNWTTEHHRNVVWKGCLEAASPISHSKQVWYQPRPGQPWLCLPESWKPPRMERPQPL